MLKMIWYVQGTNLGKLSSLDGVIRYKLIVHRITYTADQPIAIGASPNEKLSTKLHLGEYF
jgi:hypothetical protein